MDHTPIADGTYYISSQWTSNFMTLDSAAERTQVTTWPFDGGPHQQWIVSSNGQNYVLQNQLFKVYIEFDGWATTTPTPWLIRRYAGGFLIAGYHYQHFALNVDASTDNIYQNGTPIVVYPFLVTIGPDNYVWYFNSTVIPSASTTLVPSASATRCMATTVHSASTGAVAGGVVAGLVVLFLLVMAAFWIGKRRGTSTAFHNVTTSMTQPDLPPFSNDPTMGTGVMPHLMTAEPNVPSSTITHSRPGRVTGIGLPVIAPQPRHQQSYGPPMSPAPEYAAHDHVALPKAYEVA